MNIHFQLEPADHSVGIMTEGFSAWLLEDKPDVSRYEPKVPTNYWCELTTYSELYDLCEFQWYNDNGDMVVSNLPNASVIQRLLHTYAVSYYKAQEEAYANIDLPEEPEKF